MMQIWMTQLRVAMCTIVVLASSNRSCQLNLAISADSNFYPYLRNSLIGSLLSKSSNLRFDLWQLSTLSGCAADVNSRQLMHTFLASHVEAQCYLAAGIHIR